MFEDFINADVRKTREVVPITEESLVNRYQATLPQSLLDGATVLDVGSATGSAGKWCLDNGAKSYTGIELQDNYYQVSKRLLPDGEFIQSDAVEYLKTCDRQWEVVIAAGVIHGYFNPFEIIQLLCKVSADTLILESFETPEPAFPTIHFRPANMVYDSDMSKPFHGITTFVGSQALELIMNEYGFVGERIYPKPITVGNDTYNTNVKLQPNLPEQKVRYIYRFVRAETNKQSLQYKITGDV